MMKRFAKFLAVLLISTLAVSLMAGCQPLSLLVPGTTTHTPPTTAPAVQTPTVTDPSVPTVTTNPTVPTEPTVPTVPATQPTEPTQPTQPTEPEKPAFPEELQDNVYLDWMNSGFCEEMTGKMMITIIFLSDNVSKWNQDAIDTAKAAFDKDLPKLEQEAAGYGAELDVQVNYLESTIGSTCDIEGGNIMWARLALMRHGFTYAFDNPEFLEKHYQVDSAPVVFVLNREGRAFARTTSGTNQFEFVLMYSSELGAIRHELCHVFGAVDFYLPPETMEAAEQYIPESIMLDSRNGVVDELTAYLVGWTDQLGPKAEAVLRATNHITNEYLNEVIQSDQLTGYGTKRFDDCTYTGYMVKGVPHGEGTCTWDTGIVYTGNWDNGQMHGYGEISKPDGYSYKGQWKDGQYDGEGTLVYAGGKETYTGQFQKGKRHGQGTHYFANGDIYTGEWSNGIWHGQGKYTWKSGEVYEGQWSMAIRHGKGTMTWPDGSYYTGDWASGKRAGQGVLYYASNGSRYEGEFKNDKRHGTGTLYMADGTFQKGRWENDKLVEEFQESEEPEELPAP